MSKKSNTSVALLDAPGVNSNINMNLNQNDLIEMMIQERIAQIESQIQSLKMEDEDVTAIRETIDAQLKEYILSNPPKEAIPFFKAIEKLGFETKNILVNITGKHGERLDIYLFTTSRNWEQANNPLKSFNSNTREGCYDLTDIKEVDFALLISDDSITLHGKKYYTMVLPTKIRKLLVSILRIAYMKKASTTTAIHNLTKELLELQYNDKKVKAAFTKSYLSKSTEGKNILTFLQKATQINLSLP